MKSIFEEFKRGSARERLGITSDLLSIVGISFVAALAPILPSENKLTPSDIAEGMMIGLLSLAGLSLGLAISLAIHTWISTKTSNSAIRALVLVGFWCLPLSTLVYAATIFYYTFLHTY